MSRNSAGTYVLPSGNPVVPSNTITSTWANTTLADIKTEITDSLCRSGKGAMLAPLQGYDGSVSAPGFTFGADTDTGLYRVGANNPAMAIGGTNVQDWASTGSVFTIPIKVPDGAVGSPSIAFNGDPDSGFYLIGDGAIGIVIGGANVCNFQADRTRMGPLTVTGDILVGTLSASGSGATAGISADTSGTTGYAVSAKGNATRAPLHIEPQASAPSFPSKGDAYVKTSDGKLYMYDGAMWQPVW